MCALYVCTVQYIILSPASIPLANGPLALLLIAKSALPSIIRLTENYLKISSYENEIM